MECKYFYQICWVDVENGYKLTYPITNDLFDYDLAIQFREVIAKKYNAYAWVETRPVDKLMASSFEEIPLTTFYKIHSNFLDKLKEEVYGV
jgi:hypothetical protein